MDFLEREAEYKKLVMQKELAKAKAEEETMRKIKEGEKQEDFLPVLKHETPILDVRPKVEPSETKPLHVGRIINPKAPLFETPNGTAVSQVIQAGCLNHHMN